MSSSLWLGMGRYGLLSGPVHGPGRVSMTFEGFLELGEVWIWLPFLNEDWAMISNIV